jgi:glycosyltransferase involved in cell wall biosynthesis
MQGQVEITVGMPVYNGGADVERAIMSVINQTFTNFQLLISDNASTDNSTEICKKFEHLDQRIQVHRHHVNIGGIQNFYFVLEQAKTKYFVWLAHDDWWAPDFLEQNHNVLKRHSDAVCSVSKVKMMNPEGEFLRLDSGANALVKESNKNLIEFLRAPACNSRFYGLFQTSVLQKSFKLDDVYWAFDWVVMARTLTFGKHYQSNKELLFRSVTQLPSRALSRRVKVVSTNRFGGIFPMFEMTCALLRDSRVPKSLKLICICIYWNVRMFLIANFFSPIKQKLSYLFKTAAVQHQKTS